MPSRLSAPYTLRRCVFVRDVQHTIALLNFQDSQVLSNTHKRGAHHCVTGLGALWLASEQKTAGIQSGLLTCAPCSFRMCQNMVNRSIPVIREYKVVPVNSAQGRPVVDLVKFRAYMQTAVRTNSSGEQRISFNAVIAKFLQLIRYVEDECPSPTIPQTAAGRYVERDSYYHDDER